MAGLSVLCVVYNFLCILGCVGASFKKKNLQCIIDFPLLRICKYLSYEGFEFCSVFIMQIYQSYDEFTNENKGIVGNILTIFV